MTTDTKDQRAWRIHHVTAQSCRKAEWSVMPAMKIPLLLFTITAATLIGSVLLANWDRYDGNGSNTNSSSGVTD
jgi:hypothetical protein